MITGGTYRRSCAAEVDCQGRLLQAHSSGRAVWFWVRVSRCRDDQCRGEQHPSHSDFRARNLRGLLSKNLNALSTFDAQRSERTAIQIPPPTKGLRRVALYQKLSSVVVAASWVISQCPPWSASTMC
jgi:hypothetical protein